MKRWIWAGLVSAAMGVAPAAAEVVVTTAPAPRTGTPAVAPATTAPQVAATRPTTDLAPTLLTLHHEKVSPLTVFADIAAQCGRRFDPSLGEYASFVIWPLVSVQADKEPFWSVVLALDTKIGSYPELKPDGVMRSRLSSGLLGQKQVSGAFLVMALKVEHAARFEGPAELGDDCAVVMYVLPEPHIKLETMTRVCVPEVAVDENGKSLVPTALKAGPAEPMNPDWSYNNFLVRLAPPADAGKKIARLKGTLHVAVAAQETVVPVDDLSKDASEELGQADLTVSALNKDGAVNVVIKRGEISAKDWPAFAELLKTMRVTFYNDQNKAMPGMNWGGSSGPGVSKTIWAPKADMYGKKPGVPVRLTVSMAGSYQDVAVPFEFHDLPLP